MRIAIVSDYYHPSLSGITEHVHNQATELHRLGHDVTVVTGTPVHVPPLADAASRRLPPPFEVVRMGTAVPYWGNGGQTLHTVGPRLGRRLGALYRSRKFDLVHVHAPNNPRMPAWAIDATPAGALCVATFHTISPDTSLRRLQARLLRHTVARLDGRICVSEACRRRVAPLYPYAFDVIPNGVDTELFVPRGGGDSHTLAFMGRFDPRNGLALLLDAFVRLRREGRELRLLAIGDGPLAGILRRRMPHDLRGDVCWAGRVDMTRPRLLARASLLCSPCSRSAFGLVVLEAMSCGLPVVAAPSDGARLLVDHGHTGLIAAEPADAAHLADAIAAAADDPVAHAAMGAEGRRVAVERYSWRLVGARLAGYYEQLVGGRSTPAVLSAAGVAGPALSRR